MPGTVFPCSGSIRIASWTILDDATAGASIFVLNTHWDNVCQDSRERSAALVRDKIGERSRGLPVIVMGDLNATETSAAFLDVIGENGPDGLKLVDAYRSVFPVREPDEGSSIRRIRARPAQDGEEESVGQACRQAPRKAIFNS